MEMNISFKNYLNNYLHLCYFEINISIDAFFAFIRSKDASEKKKTEFKTC